MLTCGVHEESFVEEETEYDETVKIIRMWTHFYEIQDAFRFTKKKYG